MYVFSDFFACVLFLFLALTLEWPANGGVKENGEKRMKHCLEYIQTVEDTDNSKEGLDVWCNLKSLARLKGLKEMACMGVFVYLCVSGTLCGVWTCTHTPDDPPAAPAPPAALVCDAHTRS